MGRCRREERLASVGRGDVHGIGEVRMMSVGLEVGSRPGDMDDGGSLGGIVCLRICDVLGVSFARSVVLLVARVDESLMANEQVASGEGFGTDVADERLLFGVGTDVSLEVFLHRWRLATELMLKVAH
jgi:hypothetical protein